MKIDKEMLKAYMPGKTKFRRTVFFVLTDGLLLALSLFLSFYLRFDGNIGHIYIDSFWTYLLVFLTVKYMVFAMFRLYHMSWSHVGLYSLLDIIKANTISLILLGIIFMLWPESLFKGFPRSVLIIDYGMSVFLISLFRVSKRVYLHDRRGINRRDAKRTLIIGAGNVGEQIVRDMQRQQNSRYIPVGFIDDDVMKHGDYIQGVKVCGSRADMPAIVEKLNVEVALLAIPSASSSNIREILRRIRESSVKDIRIVPGINEIVTRNISLSDIKEIRIEDIMGREQVKVDERIVTGFIRSKTVLITGAGGSIGSELIRQVLAFEPEKIIALDIDETELFQMELEISRHSQGFKLVSVVADVRDRYKIEAVFNEHLPDVVFHAAAYKHVPIMERYPEEAVKVNIFGTKIIAETAIAFDVEKFVLVSTDKAVRPTNIMGATKHVAEKIIRELNALGKTAFMSVRFGNVIGSRGSVIPTFKEQIRHGGPLTVTHHEMKRYFMSIPEACILILQAAAMGKGGEVFHLDMGEQIKIVDIAREMVRINGLEPEIDIPFVFTGIREGEKLCEELLADTECSEPTEHPKIFVSKNGFNYNESVLHKVSLFEEVIKRQQWAWIRNLLKDFVPSYNPAYNGNGNGNGKSMKLSEKLLNINFAEDQHVFVKNNINIVN